MGYICGINIPSVDKNPPLADPFPIWKIIPLILHLPKTLELKWYNFLNIYFLTIKPHNVMKKTSALLTLIWMVAFGYVQGATIQINPDGSHTLIQHDGDISTQINPDGTETIVYHNGNTSTQVNPDGTHILIHRHGNISTQINPDGTHTVIYHDGDTSTQIDPDGTETIVHHNGNISTQLNPDGSQTIIHLNEIPVTPIEAEEVPTEIRQKRKKVRHAKKVKVKKLRKQKQPKKEKHIMKRQRGK